MFITAGNLITKIKKTGKKTSNPLNFNLLEFLIRNRE